MDNNLSLLNKSISGAQNDKALCFLSLAQVIGFCIVLRVAELVNNFKIFWLIPLVFIFSFSSVIVWKKAQNLHEQFKPTLTNRDLFKITLRVCLFFTGIIVVVTFLKLFNVHWALFVVLTGLFATCLAVAMLAATLFNLGLFKSFIFALDVIKHKPYFITAITLVIIFANAYGFAFAHTTFEKLSFISGFSVYQASATIWVVFLGLAVLTAFFSGILNIFIVFYFLNISNSLKDSEPGKLSMVAHSVH